MVDYMNDRGDCPHCNEHMGWNDGPRHSCAQSKQLTFAALRTANNKRCRRWHPGGIEEWSVSDWAVAMLGEAGEAANAIKKLRRIETGAKNISTDGRRLYEREAAIAAIGEELADTLLYLDLLALRLGINLEAEVRKKFDATSARYGFPERLG